MVLLRSNESPVVARPPAGGAEYITVAEAMAVTGLSEKTLKARLRGRVPMVGQQAWFREDFFGFWRAEADRKKKAARDNAYINALHT
jgi:hypothetical protein